MNKIKNIFIGIIISIMLVDDLYAYKYSIDLNTLIKNTNFYKSNYVEIDNIECIVPHIHSYLFIRKLNFFTNMFINIQSDIFYNKCHFKMKDGTTYKILFSVNNNYINIKYISKL